MKLILPAFKVRHLRANGCLSHSVLAGRKGYPQHASIPVCEAFRLPPEFDTVSMTSVAAGEAPVHYVADGPAEGWGKSRPAIHLPAWAVRMRVCITGIRYAHPHDLTDGDAEAEGVERVAQLGPLRACGWRDYQGRSSGFLRPLPSLASWWDWKYGCNAWARSPRMCILSLQCPVCPSCNERPDSGRILTNAQQAV